MLAEELIKDIHSGLWRWYDFESNAKIFNAECGMRNAELEIGQFDYIISVANLEKELNPIELLKKFKNMLKPDGTLLVGMNNRL